MAGWSPSGAGPERRPHGRGPRRRRARRRTPSSSGPTSSSSAAPATDCLHADRPTCRPVAFRLAGRRRRDRRGEHEGGHRRACRRCRPALRRRPSDGRPRDGGVRRRRRGPVRRPPVGGRAGRARQAAGRPARARPSRTRVGPWLSGSTQTTTIARSPAISHLPLVVAAASSRPSPDAGAGLADGAASLAAGGWRDTTRVARGDPAMGAAILATNAPAVAARLRDLRAVLDEWLAVLERTSTAGRTRRSPRDRPARPPRGGARAARPASVSDELVYVVPRAAVPDEAAWYGPADGRPRRLRRRARTRRPLRAARRDGARPVVQAGHPVPRPARRTALLPDAADDRRRATRDSTAATRSASAAT